MWKPTSADDYPWHRLRPGESFFVASLAPYRTAQEGLRVGLSLYGRKANLKYRAGVYKGVLGVLFTLPAKRPPAGTS